MTKTQTIVCTSTPFVGAGGVVGGDGDVVGGGGRRGGGVVLRQKTTGANLGGVRDRRGVCPGSRKHARASAHPPPFECYLVSQGVPRIDPLGTGSDGGEA